MTKSANKSEPLKDNNPVKTSSDLNPIAGKGKAGNKNAEKLTEARSVLGDKFDKVPLYGTDGKKTKEVFSWSDMFESGTTNQVHKDAELAAKEQYKAGQSSISQMMLSISRKAGSNSDNFELYYKAMCVVYKATKNRKIPQSIYDAASQIRRAHKRKINPNKYGSVESLRKAINVHDKEGDTTAIIDADNSELKALIVQVSELGNKLKTVDADLFNAFGQEIQKVVHNFDSLVVAIDDKPAKKKAA